MASPPLCEPHRHIGCDWKFLSQPSFDGLSLSNLLLIKTKSELIIINLYLISLLLKIK